MEYPAGNLYIKEAVDGIIEMFESYGRVDANKVVVLIVDGKASSVDGMEKVLAKAKEAGLNFYIIGKCENCELHRDIQNCIKNSHFFAKHS